MQTQDAPRHPLETAGRFSRFTFSWVGDIIAKVGDKPFDQSMHTPLRPEDDIRVREAEFERRFVQSTSLYRLLFHFFDFKLGLTAALFFWLTVDICNIMLIYCFTAYVQNHSPEDPIDRWVIAQYFGALVVIMYFNTIVDVHIYFQIFTRMITVKNNFLLQIIKRVFAINIRSSDQTSRGNIVNLIQSDCSFIEDEAIWILFSIHNVTNLLICLSIGLVMLGWVFLVYIVACSFFLLILSLLQNFIVAAQTRLFHQRDKRVSALANIFSNIRFVKFTAMENFFAKIIHQIREKELDSLKRVYWIMSVVILIEWMAPNECLVALYWTIFALRGGMTPELFTLTQQIGNTVQLYFMWLPETWSLIIRLQVVVKRMNLFFAIRKIDDGFLERVPSGAEQTLGTEDWAIEIEDCVFSFKDTDQEQFNRVCEEDKSDDEGLSSREMGEARNRSGSGPSGKNQNQAQEASGNEGSGHRDSDSQEDFPEEDPNRQIPPRKSSGKLTQSFREPRNSGLRKKMSMSDTNLDLDKEGVFEEEAVILQGEGSEKHPDRDLPVSEEDFEQISESAHQQPPEGTPRESPKQKDFELIIDSLKIEKGKLVFIIGKIGSGKSALAQALLGELAAGPGSRVRLEGSLSYCPQTPFLMTKSIQENIVFYRDFDEQALLRATKLAALDEDLATFSDGIKKVVTEGALNLSGGQRSRVNLARCFYAPADIYLLDDPFSALDVNVSRRIIEETIQRELAGSTRVVITHSIQYLPYADQVVFMEKGKIEFQGSFEEFQGTDYFHSLQKTVTRDESLTKTGPEGLPVSLRPRKHSESQVIPSDSERQHSAFARKLLPHQDPPHPGRTGPLPSEDPQDITAKYFSEEDRYEGRQLQLFLHLLRKYYGGFWCLATIVLLVFASQIALYFANLYLLHFIKYQQTHGGPYNPTMVRYFAFITLPGVTVVIRLVIENMVCFLAAKRLHRSMVIRSLHGDLFGFFDRIESGRLLNRFSKDTALIDEEMPMHFSFFPISLATFFFDIFVMGRNLSLVVWGAALVFLVILLHFQNKYLRLKKDVRRLEATTKTPIINLTTEIITGREVIKTYGQQQAVLEDLRKLINENSKNLVWKRALDSWFNLKVLNYGMFCVQLVTFGAFVAMFRTTEDPLELALMLTYVTGFLWTIEMLAEHLSELESMFVSVERCDSLAQIEVEKGYLNFPKEEAELPDRLENDPLRSFVVQKEENLDGRRWRVEEINQPGFAGRIFIEGWIRLKDVWAKYPVGEHPALRGVSFEVRPGTKLGIVGKTGSGKSSIIKLLTRYLSPYQGTVAVDGYDLSQLDLKQLRSEILVVSQEIALFEGTLLENMNPEMLGSPSAIAGEATQTSPRPTPAHVDPTDSELAEPLLGANRQRELEEPSQESQMIECLIKFGFSAEKLAKSGLNFRLTTGGDNLSPGEQQLVAIFRALFTSKRIIILDEATASIDYETETNIMTYLYEKVYGKTLIMIAHRINTVMLCDEVMVMEDGRIAERGPPSRLIADGGSRFGRMYHQLNSSTQ